MNPTVSVQIVTYNSEEDIERCLKAVAQQTYPIEKIMVVDNASKDCTVKKVKQFSDVSIVANKENTGFAPAHNQAINMTTTNYVLVLNPDVQLHENYIKNIIKVMVKDNSIGMAIGKLYRDEANKVLDSTGIVMKKNRRAIDRGAGQIDSGQFDKKTNVFGVSGAAAIYKREMIEEISYQSEFFDEVFFAYKEDVDVCWRAQLLGWQGVFVPDAIACHGRGWNEDRKRSDVPVFIRQKSYINRYFYMMKNESKWDFILHFPFILFFEFASFSYTILKERELFAAWRFFKQQWPSMKEKRRAIITRKKATNKLIRSFYKGIW